jgi:hypothetical protein
MYTKERIMLTYRVEYLDLDSGESLVDFVESFSDLPEEINFALAYTIDPRSTAITWAILH